MKLGVDVLPRFPRDTTDRNRTSPFAFTGNKFEFRMLGSSNCIACANIMLNAAVAESLKIYADRLEGAEDFETALHDMIKKTIKDHKRIIFNGNGYDATWIKEATEVRGLCNYRTTPDCMPHLLDKKNVDMLTAHKIYSVSEIQARCDIMLENYCKAVIIEANTMVDMARKQILPAVEGYAAELAASVAAKKAVAPNLACAYETGLVTKLSGLTDQIAEKTDELESAVLELKNAENVEGRVLRHPGHHSRQDGSPPGCRGRGGDPDFFRLLAIPHLRRTAVWREVNLLFTAAHADHGGRGGD